jgi:catechol 2,3-dioxygenase-like lactoylglutathione lyase family enzyme
MSPEHDASRSPGTVVGFDHIALPLQNAAAMVAFYRALGWVVSETALLVRVHFGHQMINFHKPELWQGDFALRASAAQPPCGDICLVWEGAGEALTSLLRQAGVEVIEGPVEREGGRRSVAMSRYARDPDGNLVEFMNYSEAAASA